MRGGIVAAGNIVRDCNKLLERFPEENGLVRCRGLRVCPGGGAANVGISLAQLDPRLDVRPLCLVGEDAEGEALLRALGACPNIDLSLVGRRGQTAFADVLTCGGGSMRSFVYYPGANALLDIEDFAPETLECDIVHIGYALALDRLDAPDKKYGTRMARLMCMLRQRGIRTSFDVVSEASDRYAKIVPACLPYADCVFMNEVEAGRTIGRELRAKDGSIDPRAVRGALLRLREMGAEGKVLLHMPEGAAGIDESGEIRFAAGAEIAPERIAAAVGAGDAFAAGALIALHRGQGLAQMLECGIAAATACLLREEPTAGRTLEQAQTLLDGFGRTKMEI